MVAMTSVLHRIGRGSLRTGPNSLVSLRHFTTRSSVNAEEVGKFDAQAAQWWDPTGVARGLHRMNATRISYIRGQIERQIVSGEREAEILERKDASKGRSGALAGVNILDVGCGGGLVTEPLSRLDGNVLGIDMSSVAIDVAREHASRDVLIDPSYERLSVEDVVTRGDKFDVVLALEIVEHVDEPMKFVADCCELVSPGGIFILSTLNRTTLSYMLGIVAAERVLGWVPPGTHDWNKFVTPEEVSSAILSESDLVPGNVSGLRFNALSGGFDLCDDAQVNYIMCARRPLQPSTAETG